MLVHLEYDRTVVALTRVRCHCFLERVTLVAMRFVSIRFAGRWFWGSWASRY